MSNIQNFNDIECFKLCLVRCLHPVDYDAAIIRKIGKLLGDELDFEDLNIVRPLPPPLYKEGGRQLSTSNLAIRVGMKHFF